VGFRATTSTPSPPTSVGGALSRERLLIAKKKRQSEFAFIEKGRLS
jgi:hypothetical protein